MSKSLWIKYQGIKSNNRNKAAYQSKARTTRNYVLRSYDLDLDPMTLILYSDLDILKMYLHIRNNVSRSRLSKARIQIGQTHRRTQPKLLPQHIRERAAGEG